MWIGAGVDWSGSTNLERQSAALFLVQGYVVGCQLESPSVHFVIGVFPIEKFCFVVYGLF